jgi:hypothetical protein
MAIESPIQYPRAMHCNDNCIGYVLQNGDSFSLIPGQYNFRVEVISPPSKRKIESTTDSTVKKQKSDEEVIPTKKDDRPICKYGSECYRKNADHWKEFSHETETKIERRSTNKEEEDIDEDIEKQLDALHVPKSKNAFSVMMDQAKVKPTEKPTETKPKGTRNITDCIVNTVAADHRQLYLFVELIKCS